MLSDGRQRLVGQGPSCQIGLKITAYSTQAERVFALPELERPRQIVAEKERV